MTLFLSFPCYLNGTDGIFNLSYYQLLPGLDATVFASYYEPWGYTPLESIAFGVPTVTTTLAGFGQWILATAPNSFEGSGVRVAERTDSNYQQAVDAITADLRTLIAMPAAEIKDVRAAASAEAVKFLWTDFIKYYLTAYNEAIASAKSRKQK